MKKGTETKFFRRITEKLEGLFPKDECKERGEAMTLNAYAVIAHDEIVERLEQQHKAQMREAIEEIKEKIEDSDGDAAFCAGLETALNIFKKHGVDER